MRAEAVAREMKPPLKEGHLVHGIVERGLD